LVVVEVAVDIQALDQGMQLPAEVVVVEHGILLGLVQVQQEPNLNNIAFRANMDLEILALQALET
jgi:hypothetical protein